MSLRRAASVSAARALTLVSICWASSRAFSVVMGSVLRGFLVLAVVVNQQPLSHPAARAGVASASRGGSPTFWSAADVERKEAKRSGGLHGTQWRKTGDTACAREGRRPLGNVLNSIEAGSRASG